MPETPPGDGRALGWLNAIKGLTLTNVAVIALLLIVAVPLYVIYKALAIAALLDRLLSTYEEKSSQQYGCTLRHVQARGGPEAWGISTGFAFSGADRWQISVILDHEPTAEDLDGYCATAKLLADSSAGWWAVKLVLALLLVLHSCAAATVEFSDDQCRVLRQMKVNINQICHRRQNTTTVTAPTKGAPPSVAPPTPANPPSAASAPNPPDVSNPPNPPGSGPGGPTDPGAGGGGPPDGGGGGNGPPDGGGDKAPDPPAGSKPADPPPGSKPGDPEPRR